jgi:cytochrome b
MASIDSSTKLRPEVPSRTRSEWVTVWDPIVRISHWVLVAAFAIAYLSEDALEVHVPVGYLLGATLALRIVWASWARATRASRTSCARPERRCATWAICCAGARPAIWVTVQPVPS